MAKHLYNTIQEEIRALKKERNAVIVAPNYQVGELQDVADFLGDYLNLARYAQKTSADVIVFCGVHFMAETASILCPKKMVLIPEIAATCSLADMVTPQDIRHWRSSHPCGVVVCYVNTPASVKAESDYCCTSANAEKVVLTVPEDKEILFVPDYFLGTYVKKMTGRKIHLWNGYCGAHSIIRSENIDALRHAHPKAEFIMHPECGCTTKSMDLADKVLSTVGMLAYVSKSPAKEFIVATETGILYKMNKDNPDKKFYPGSEQAVCSYMKQNSLEKLVTSLEELRYQIKAPDDIARRAQLSIDRMVAIG